MFVLFYTFPAAQRKIVDRKSESSSSYGGNLMPRSIYLGAMLAILAIAVIERAPRVSAFASPKPAAKPEFTADGKLVRPEGYRKWVFLSSGYGMSYSQGASSDQDHLMFTNVFVPPADYDYFLARGTWPDKTMFVLEMYGSQSKGSINQHGHFQTELMGLDVEVKDASRFPDKWAYFGFDADEKSSSATSPGKNDCWKCHDQNAAVEHTFVQFYPVLLSVAKEKKTIKDGVKLP
jgi:Cytochrome P460